MCYDGESKEQCEEREAAAAGAKLNYHEVAYVNNPHTCGPPGQIHLVLGTCFCHIRYNLQELRLITWDPPGETASALLHTDTGNFLFSRFHSTVHAN